MPGHGEIAKAPGILACSEYLATRATNPLARNHQGSRSNATMRALNCGVAVRRAAIHAAL